MAVYWAYLYLYGSILFLDIPLNGSGKEVMQTVLNAADANDARPDHPTVRDNATESGIADGADDTDANNPSQSARWRV